MERSMLLEFCDEKDLCIANTCFKKNQVTYSAGANVSDIDFVLVKGITGIKGCKSDFRKTAAWTGNCGSSTKIK